MSRRNTGRFQVPRFLGIFGACTDSGYQALLSSPALIESLGTRLGLQGAIKHMLQVGNITYGIRDHYFPLQAVISSSLALTHSNSQYDSNDGARQSPPASQASQEDGGEHGKGDGTNSKHYLLVWAVNTSSPHWRLLIHNHHVLSLLPIIAIGNIVEPIYNGYSRLSITITFCGPEGIIDSWRVKGLICPRKAPKDVCNCYQSLLQMLF